MEPSTATTSTAQSSKAGSYTAKASKAKSSMSEPATSKFSTAKMDMNGYPSFRAETESGSENAPTDLSDVPDFPDTPSLDFGGSSISTSTWSSHYGSHGESRRRQTSSTDSNVRPLFPLFPLDEDSPTSTLHSPALNGSDTFEPQSLGVERSPPPSPSQFLVHLSGGLSGGSWQPNTLSKRANYDSHSPILDSSNAASYGFTRSPKNQMSAWYDCIADQPIFDRLTPCTKHFQMEDDAASLSTTEPGIVPFNITSDPLLRPGQTNISDTKTPSSLHSLTPQNATSEADEKTSCPWGFINNTSSPRESLEREGSKSNLKPRGEGDSCTLHSLPDDSLEEVRKSFDKYNPWIPSSTMSPFNECHKPRGERHVEKGAARHLTYVPDGMLRDELEAQNGLHAFQHAQETTSHERYSCKPLEGSNLSLPFSNSSTRGSRLDGTAKSAGEPLPAENEQDDEDITLAPCDSAATQMLLGNMTPYLADQAPNSVDGGLIQDAFMRELLDSRTTTPESSPESVGEISSPESSWSTRSSTSSESTQLSIDTDTARVSRHLNVSIYRHILLSHPLMELNTSENVTYCSPEPRVPNCPGLTVGSSRETESGEGSQGTSGKRLRKSNEDDPDDDDLGDSPGKGGKVARVKQDAPLKFACIYHKREPKKYNEGVDGRYKICQKGFCNITRLKEHFDRKHMAPPHCTRCGQLFSSQDDADEHRDRGRPPCEPTDEKPVGITEIQMYRWKKKGREWKTGRAKWEGMYGIVFPGEPLPPDPYVHDVGTELTLPKSIGTSENDYVENNLPSHEQERSPALRPQIHEAFSDANLECNAALQRELYAAQDEGCVQRQGHGLRRPNQRQTEEVSPAYNSAPVNSVGSNDFSQAGPWSVLQDWSNDPPSLMYSSSPRPIIPERNDSFQQRSVYEYPARTSALETGLTYPLLQANALDITESTQSSSAFQAPGMSHPAHGVQYYGTAPFLNQNYPSFWEPTKADLDFLSLDQMPPEDSGEHESYYQS